MTTSTTLLMKNTKKAARVWRENGKEWAFNQMKYAYSELVARLVREGSSKQDMVDYAVMLLPDVCKGFVTAKDHMYDELSSNLLIMLTTNDNLDLLLKQNNGETTLAWFCCDHSVYYARGGFYKVASTFRQLLTRFTGKDLESDADKNPELDYVVTLLYGQACWDLYGSDPIEELNRFKLGELTTRFARENFPLVFKTQTSAEPSSTSNETLDTLLPDAFF